MEEPYFIFDQPTDLHRLSEMVFVEGGTFRMGAKDDDTEVYSWEKPAHDVRLSSFYIGKYPVTQAFWETVMGNNPSRFKGADRPVENVSWDDTQDFIRKLYGKTGIKYQLPTEAQWEYAARGGKYWNKYPFKYAGSDKLNEVAWYDENSHDETKPVGLKTPNLLDLHDMSGNVWEWCSDKRTGGENYDRLIKESKKDPVTGALDNPTGVVEGFYRVPRGGGWLHSEWGYRPTLRGSDTPSNSYRDMGFRLALFSPSV